MTRQTDQDAAVPLSRRALLRGAAGAPVALCAGASAAHPAPDPVLRDAMLRGLAQMDQRADGVSSLAARAAAGQLQQTDPEGALLVRLYRALDDRPSRSTVAGARAAAPDTLRLLQQAIAARQPVHFAYTDLKGDASTRTVLPLVLVSPPQGIKLLARCQKAEDFRQFFVREISGCQIVAGDFSAQWLTLLEGLADKEGA